MTRHALLRPLRALALIAPLFAPACRRERDRPADGEAPRGPQPTLATPAPATARPAPAPQQPAAQQPAPQQRAPKAGGRPTPRTAPSGRDPAAPALPATAARPVPSAATGLCTVKSVHDGDTVRCTDDRRLRLLLIDAPELGQRPFGERARTALRALLPVGTAVRYETDVERQDRYRRTLAYVYLPDGRMANEEMVRQGYAVPLVYRPNVRYEARMQAAAAAARREGRGLHADSGFACLPREHRRKAC
jgi:micrococcal nuclease